MTSAPASWRAPRAFRCTRSRRCACCSTAGSSCRRATAIGRRGGARRWRWRRTATLPAPLGATGEAQRAFERAGELTEDPLVQAELHERAGVLAWGGGRPGEASAHWEQSIALFEAEGATHPAARVEARLAEAMWDRG